MTDNIESIRHRIHQKSEKYFTFSRRRRDAKALRMFYGATDALLDASMAGRAFSRAVQSDPAVNLLACYGFLQAIYIQQDAVLTLSRSVGLEWRPNDAPRIKEIRELRNRLTGHPALAGENEKPPRPSSAVIAYNNISPTKFSGHIYLEGRSEIVEIQPASILEDNEKYLTIQLLEIEAVMDDQERQFRSEQAKEPLSDEFGVGFSYLLERLCSDLGDEGRVIQATTHAGMIEEKIVSLNQSLEKRNLHSEAISYHVGIILDGLILIKEILAAGDSSSRKQNQFDMICDGFVVNINKLKNIIAEIDKKMMSSVDVEDDY